MDVPAMRPSTSITGPNGLTVTRCEPKSTAPSKEVTLAPDPSPAKKSGRGEMPLPTPALLLDSSTSRLLDSVDRQIPIALPLGDVAAEIAPLAALRLDQPIEDVVAERVADDL